MYDGLMEEAATNTDVKASKVVNKHVNPMNPYLKARLPKIKSINQRARRKKNQVQGQLPPNPQTLESIDIPDDYKVITMKDGSVVEWLLYDSAIETGDYFNRSFIFSTPKNLEILRNCPTLFCDGTFKVSRTMLACLLLK